METSRGLKISKEKASHKIDVVVALAMAALGGVENPVVERRDVPPHLVFRRYGERRPRSGTGGANW